MKVYFFNEIGTELVTGDLITPFLEGENGKYTRFELLISVSADAFDRIEANRYFNYTFASRLGEVSFKKDYPIEMTVRLDENLVQLVEPFGDNLVEILQSIFQDPQDGLYITVFQVKNWYLLKAVQEEDLPLSLRSSGASLKTGLRTAWDLPELDRLQHLSRNGGGQIRDTVLGYFAEQGIRIGKVPGKDYYIGTIKGVNGVWDFYTVVDEKLSRCIFYSVLPYKADENRRLSAMEFITRANDGLPVGNFEIDLTDGEIKFKTALEVEWDRLSPGLFGQVVSANINNMDKYFRGFIEVLLENADPSAVINEIEA